MKKIIITNAYTWNNKGDAAILLSTVDVLNKIFYKPEVNILSFTPNLDREKYSFQKTIKNIENNILNPHPYKHTKAGKIIAICRLIIKAIYIRFRMLFLKKAYLKKNNTLRLISECDIILVCGGGFLGGKKFDSFMHLYQIYINTLFNKPVFILGTSVEPIHNKLIDKITKNILKRVDYIFAREEITEAYLETFLDKDKHCQIPDMAFMLDDGSHRVICHDSQIDKIRQEGKKLFGITVRDWNFPNSSNPVEAKRNYINAVGNAMCQLAKKYDSYFIFIPQVIVPYRSDIDIAKQIKEKINIEYRERFIIKEDDWSPYQIRSIISQLDFFIGTRMHSNIFALSECVPTLAIAYEKKTNGIMSTVGMDKYVLDINNISESQIIDKINKLIDNNNNIRKLLTRKNKNLQREIMTVILDKIGDKQ